MTDSPARADAPLDPIQPSAGSRSQRAAERLRDLVPGGAHAYSKTAAQWPSTAPAMLSHGRGAWVWDLDGVRYLDWFAGLSSVPLGHAHPAVTAAVTRALERGTNFQLPAHAELRAAGLFLDATGDEMVKFGKNASDAVDGAIKLARHATGRTTIARAADQPFFSTGDWFIATTAAASGTLPGAAAHTLGFPYNDRAALARLFTDHRDDLAAVICEPVRFVRPEPEFFADLRRLCTAHGTVLIFDETVTGLKYEFPAARPLTGITPDLTIWGKGIANGLPLSALTGRADLMRQADTTRPPKPGRAGLLMMSSTHGGEAASLAAMTATLTVMRREQALLRTRATGTALRNTLDDALTAADVQDHLTLTGYPVFLGLHARGNEHITDHELRALFIQEVVRRACLFRGIFYATHAHVRDHVDLTADAVAAAATTCARALAHGPDGLLERPPPRRVL
ncbi:aminotransferase class III-fold pyridoxal phosphate-dependent enzyme [Actinomadura atramentaria]|uniref:aminotransferase class III-fold pyridoxal phosphate-dependent enzyme n=1 Tax=Actinomadura atramentaria TaxID=1990 RepID=UPI00036367E4|nr:aminotransferase class III-fold pyridoxal phosphate-dependent enzyme [Actinomadura atramentaria]